MPKTARTLDWPKEQGWESVSSGNGKRNLRFHHPLHLIGPKKVGNPKTRKAKRKKEPTTTSPPSTSTKRTKTCTFVEATTLASPAAARPKRTTKQVTSAILAEGPKRPRAERERRPKQKNTSAKTGTRWTGEPGKEPGRTVKKHRDLAKFTGGAMTFR